jgi:aminoglycoside 6-adenylyltransferase
MEIRGDLKLVEKIVDWARADDNIRVVLITSSMVNPFAPIDKLSDYDIVLFVKTPQPLLENESWMTQFGDIVAVFWDSHEDFGIRGYTRLVQYADTTKIDFIIDPVEILENLTALPSLPDHYDIGYKVLLDKDGLAVDLPEPTYQAFIPKVPSEDEYQNVVNEFWWDSTYVAKNLWRDQLFPAKYSAEIVMRFFAMVKMLEWYHQVDRGWNLNPGIMGKGAKKYLSKDEWEEVEATFSGSDVESNWVALFNMMDFFRKISVAVAENLGYRYPYDLDRKVTEYIKKVKVLEK